MAELKARVTADIAGFTRAMNRTKFSARSATDFVKTAFIGLSAATLGLGFSAIKTALKYEEMGKRMRVIFGEEKGKKFFEDLSKFAAKSAADTQELIQAASIVAGIMGTRQTPEFYEAVVFASKQMNKTVLEGSMLLGKFFKILETGGKMRKDLLLQLGQVFGSAFIDRVRAGEITYLDAMRKFESQWKVLAKWGEGLGGEINKLGGAWSEFLRRIGEGKNLEAIQEVVAHLSRILEELADSGVLEELGEGFANIAKEIKMEDIKSMMEGVLSVMDTMTKVLKHLVKNWKLMVGVAVAYKLAIHACTAAQLLLNAAQFASVGLAGSAGGAAAGGGAGAGVAAGVGAGIGGGLATAGGAVKTAAAGVSAGALGTSLAILATAAAGLAYGYAGGKGIAERMDSVREIDYGSHPYLKKYKGESLPIEVKVVDDDGENAF